ncbi:MAG: hypothetical protein JSS64_01850 [Bacteroidetes bacterium]|nr:hypothetical protein [Bacteroidota bacterium]
MAKSFRKTPSQSPDSKKDYLDLLEEGKESKGGKKSEKATHIEAHSPETVTPEVVRQTFIIGPDYLDKMKDLVYTKRRAGQFEYSQKDALHEALDLLFGKNKIGKRPAEVREKEEKRNLKIREARR